MMHRHRVHEKVEELVRTYRPRTPSPTSGTFRFVVHQAAGMIAVQLGITVADALVQLRARAFSTDRPIVDIARDVVARRLRFADPDR
jgi:hypothetical protein